MRSTKYILNPKGIPGKHGAQGSLHMSRDDATLMSERYRSVPSDLRKNAGTCRMLNVYTRTHESPTCAKKKTDEIIRKR